MRLLQQDQPSIRPRLEPTHGYDDSDGGVYTYTFNSDEQKGVHGAL